VLINAEKDYIRTGDFSTVKITAAEDFDLYAAVIVEK
jgi:ribosomal protein S12 methylthiotransferase